jgi:hypothetical protein
METAMANSQELRRGLNNLAQSIKKSEQRRREGRKPKPAAPTSIAKQIYPHLRSVHDKPQEGKR